MFDKKRCIANIYQLAKERGLRLGDLEKKAGVSAGYLSRINKEENNSSPSIDFIAAVAEALGVTVDALVNNDYATPTPTEKYLLDFIDRLLARTNADELDWKRDSSIDLADVGFDPEGDPLHPLFTHGPDGIHQAPVYNSRFNSDHEISGDCFRLKLSESSRNASVLYLMCTDIPDGKNLPFGDEDLELYLVNGWQVKPLCHANPSNSPLYSALHTLYQAATESSKHPKLDQDVMQIINAFMAEEVEEVDDGDLPF